MKTLGLIKIGLAVVALAGLAHGGDITDITCDCGSTKGTISKVTMQGCDANVASGYCPAPQGSMAHGQFEFTPIVNIDSFSCEMTTNFAPVGIPCPEADGCKSIANNVTCPIKAGTKVVYNIDINVLSAYPKMQLLGNINLRLNKHDKTDAICMQLPIDILPASDTTVAPVTTTKAPVTTKTTAAPTTTKAPVTTKTTAAPTTTKAPVTTTKGTPSTASTTIAPTTTKAPVTTTVATSTSTKPKKGKPFFATGVLPFCPGVPTSGTSTSSGPSTSPNTATEPSTATTTSGSSETRPVALLLAAVASVFLALF